MLADARLRTRAGATRPIGWPARRVHLNRLTTSLADVGAWCTGPSGAPSVRPTGGRRTGRQAARPCCIERHSRWANCVGRAAVPPVAPIPASGTRNRRVTCPHQPVAHCIAHSHCAGSDRAESAAHGCSQALGAAEQGTGRRCAAHGRGTATFFRWAGTVCPRRSLLKRRQVEPTVSLACAGLILILILILTPTPILVLLLAGRRGEAGSRDLMRFRLRPGSCEMHTHDGGAWRRRTGAGHGACPLLLRVAARQHAACGRSSVPGAGRQHGTAPAGALTPWP